LSPLADNHPPLSRTLALTLVCLFIAGIALWRHFSLSFPSWERWDAPAACDGYAGVYGDLRTQGTVCLGPTPLSWGDAVAKMGGADCTLSAADAEKLLSAGERLSVSAAGPQCLVTPDRFSGAELLALGMPIDINLAEARDLEALPSIGPALAARIVEFRAQNGPFRSVSDLSGVKGIGPATLQKIAGKLTVGR